MKKIISAVKAIASGFKDLINFIQLIFKLIGNVLKQLVYFIEYLLQGVNIAFTFIAQLPPWLKVFASTTVTICIIYMVLNRQGGKN